MYPSLLKKVNKNADAAIYILSCQIPIENEIHKHIFGALVGIKGVIL